MGSESGGGRAKGMRLRRRQKAQIPCGNDMQRGNQLQLGWRFPGYDERKGKSNLVPAVGPDVR